MSDITVKRPANDARTSWETVDADKTLLELGFTQKNAKPDDPASLAYTIPGRHFWRFKFSISFLEDKDVVQIEALSEPPPLHDALQSSTDF